MIYGVAKVLTFVTIFGVMLALAVYYFDIQLDLQNLEMTSNISKCIHYFFSANALSYEKIFLIQGHTGMAWGVSPHQCFYVL